MEINYITNRNMIENNTWIAYLFCVGKTDELTSMWGLFLFSLVRFNGTSAHKSHQQEQIAKFTELVSDLGLKAEEARDDEIIT